MASSDVYSPPGGLGCRLVKWEFQTLRRELDASGVLTAPLGRAWCEQLRDF
jgi:hypothetical protein